MKYKKNRSYCFGTGSGLVVRASDSGGRGQGFNTPCCVLEQDTFTPLKVLVEPRKQWVCPDMAKKLFTGMLSQNESKQKKHIYASEKMSV